MADAKKKDESAHKLIVGLTKSGKSVCARAMVREAVKRGIVGVVYDPTLSSDWGTEFVTCDEHQFLTWLSETHKKGLPMVVPVDEADTFFSLSHRHNFWLASRGRHFGIELIPITQRPTMIAPTVRSQCNADVYVFQLGASDAKLLATETGAPDLVNAVDLRQGEFLRAHWVDGKKVVDHLKIF